MIKETKRQSKERISNILKNIPIETKEDRNNIYSWKHLRDDNVLIEYNYDYDKNWEIKYCPDCNQFTCHFGRCRVCQSKESGLGNPEIHQRTIDNQIKNGTFNMLQPEMQKNKKSNSNIKYKHITKICPRCNRETKHRIWPNGKTSCCNCDFKNNGLKMKFCEKCGKETLHNGSICTICKPEAGVQNNLHYEYCPKCQNITLFNGTKCTVCIPSSFASGVKYEFCETCNTITLHNNHVCGQCHPEILPSKPNITIIDGVRFYKDRELNSLVKDLLSGIENIEDYPGFSISYGKVFYYGIDVLSDEFLSIQGNFHIIDDIKYYKQIPVTELISKIKSNEIDINTLPGFSIHYDKIYYFGIDILTDEFLSLVGNFQTIDGIRYYKNEQVDEISRKILDKTYNIKNFPGFNIRLGRVCYLTQDILTGEKIITNGANFVVYNNVEFILDHRTNEYVVSKIFFEEFNKKVKDQATNNKEIQQLINEDGFSVEPIIKTSEDMWNRNQTDKNLVNKGYGWIVYIKLFHGKPWIVGKTGTTLVSASPVDFDFLLYNPENIYDPDYNGPGRTYARRYYPEELYSDFDYVLCKNFECEQEALDFEEKMLTKYVLFPS